MSYCPQFWGSRGFAWLVRPNTCRRVKTKNLFFAFYFRFSYYPQLWHSTEIYNDRKTQHMFESYDQKLIVFAFYSHFHELLPIVWGFLVRFTWLERPDTCLRVRTKNS